MIGRAHISATALGAIATCCLVMAGCAAVKPAKTAERVPIAVPADPIVVVAPPAMPAPEVAPEAAPKAAPKAAPEAATIPQPTPTAPAAVVPSKAREPVVAPAVIAPVRPAPSVAPAPRVAPPAVPKVTKAPAPVLAQPAPAPLDLASLGTRLKQTKAIGVLTKLSLKNQVDDLLAKFRAYHTRQGAATLPELRRSYDMLLLKVLSLLQDSDPPLARDIVQSRAAIWGVLADPKKFNEARLMAGATT